MWRHKHSDNNIIYNVCRRKEIIQTLEGLTRTKTGLPWARWNYISRLPLDLKCNFSLGLLAYRSTLQILGLPSLYNYMNQFFIICLVMCMCAGTHSILFLWRMLTSANGWYLLSIYYVWSIFLHILWALITSFIPYNY